MTSEDAGSDHKAGATKTLVRHGFVYGLGQVALRLGSILLLPVYTRYLTPTDYGVIALVDIIVGLLGVVVGGQAASAATRQHFSERWGKDPAKVWWNAFWFVCLADVVVIAPALLALPLLARITFGSSVAGGEMWLFLGLATLALSPIEQLGLAYLRAEKRSTAVVVLSIVRLLFNIAANLTFLMVLQSGVMAVLLGNLVTAVFALVLTLVVSIWRLKPTKLDGTLAKTLLKFSAPLLVTGASSLVMHETGRFSLRLFSNLHDVGVYGLAQQIGQGVNSLLILPFSMIFTPMAMEVASRPHAHWFYKTVFRVFIGFLGVTLFAVSVLAPEIFALLIGPDFQQAAALVPILCLAFFIFSLHSHFSIPAMVAEKTWMIIPAAGLGALVAVVGNAALIPRFGVYGSAFASVLAYSAFSFGGLLLYRRIDKISYGFGEVFALMVGFIATYALCAAWREAVPQHFGFVAPVATIAAWVIGIGWRHKWLSMASLLTARSDAPAAA